MKEGDGQSRLTRLRRNLSIVDILTTLYLAYFTLRLVLSPEGPQQRFGLMVFGIATVTYGFITILIRGDYIAPSRGRGLLYRANLFLTLLITYFIGFKAALFGMDLTLVDDALAGVDRAVFGVVPAVWCQSFADVRVVEWLSFFYYGHFAVVALALIPPIFTGRQGEHEARLFGAWAVIIIGWVTYTFVPAMGPYQVMDFKDPIQGGLWYGLVMETVNSSGPLIDVFPSLHTAFTLFVGLHLFQYRHRRFYKYLSWVCLFMAVNIIVATIYLRFHYVVDVFAGIALAVVAARYAPGFCARYQQRVSAGAQPLLGEPLED